MTLVQIALRYLRARWFPNLLTAACVSLGVGLLVAVIVVAPVYRRKSSLGERRGLNRPLNPVARFVHVFYVPECVEVGGRVAPDNKQIARSSSGERPGKIANGNRFGGVTRAGDQRLGVR